MIVENYLDPDVGYLLGLLTATGQIAVRGSNPIVSIDFLHRSLEAKGVRKAYDQEHYVEYSLLKIKERLSGTLGHTIEHVMQPGRGTIVINFPGRPISYRNLLLHLGENLTPKTSRVPAAIFGAPGDIQREFMRGFADAAGFVRASNADQSGLHRVYLQITNANWILPIEICRLLQFHLKVPVHSIQWGHPNIRTPHDPDSRSWGKEHQLRVFAQDFTRIGFYVTYKEEILNELAQENVKARKSRFCNPNAAVRRNRKKPKHPGEKSEKIPDPVRRHFDAYWQVCLALGCEQCRRVEGEPTEMFGDDE